MYNYVGDLCSIYHFIINNYIENKKVAIDATLGNGHDTDFLSKNFNRVYAFDIQKNAIDNYKEKKKDNVVLINDSHSKFRNYINEEVQCIVYNLGFLPGGDKSITTSGIEVVETLKKACECLNSNGKIIVVCYPGFEAGMNESILVENYLKELSSKQFDVYSFKLLNRKNAPYIIGIEKH